MNKGKKSFGTVAGRLHNLEKTANIHENHLKGITKQVATNSAIAMQFLSICQVLEEKGYVTTGEFQEKLKKLHETIFDGGQEDSEGGDVQPEEAGDDAGGIGAGQFRVLRAHGDSGNPAGPGDEADEGDGAGTQE